MAVLKVKSITKEFDGVKALDDLSFEIEKKSIFALIGPNGSGKTTLFNIITGFLEKDRGSIVYKDKDVTFLKPYQIARLGIGRTFQNIRLFPQISVLDNVMLAFKYETGENFFAGLLQTKKMKNEDSVNQLKAEELLKSVGLIEKINKLGEELSHGQRKLLELARALALDPELLLLDEPAAGLFPEMKRLMLNHIKALKDKGKTILFIEHDMYSVMAIADKIIVINHGKKIAEGKPEEIRTNKEVQVAYLGKSII
ncbi:MAG: ABC transporter ATP-binding protein [bacterium]|nr:ABC transporter ATP-binding protein [bacterium]